MEHGIVQDWNEMERIWQYIYSKDQLQTFSEEVTDLLKPLMPFTGIHYISPVNPGASYSLYGYFSFTASSSADRSPFESQKKSREGC